jgi:hypothetical protein
MPRLELIFLHSASGDGFDVLRLLSVMQIGRSAAELRQNDLANRRPPMPTSATHHCHGRFQMPIAA